MHESHEIEKKLRTEAAKISSDLGGASIVIIAAGNTDKGIPRTMTASSIKGKDIRLRDLLGILQTSIQIESWKHFKNWK